MAKGSRIFSNLVFIRNVTANLENYSFDYEMLEVFYAVDGNKTVTEVAVDLGKSVPELKPAFERLSRQKLILSAPRNLSGGSPSPDEDPEVSAPAKDSPEIDLNIRDLDDLISEVAYSEDDHAPDPFEDPDALNRPTIPDQSCVAPPQDEGVVRSTPQPPTGPGVDGADETLQDKDQENPFVFLDPTDPEEAPEPSDLFRYSKPVESPSTLFDAFSRNTAASHPEPDSDSPFMFSKKKAGTAGFPGTAGTSEEDNEQVDPPLNAKGLEHFENGLAALQDKLYAEALVQFELASDLDPNNRLCKANIQRIKKILNEGS
jgi:hypothetical protein